MLRFMADDYDDTCSTVFPFLQVILSNVRFHQFFINNNKCFQQYKRLRKVSSEPLDEGKRSFITSLLQVTLTKMKWDKEADLDVGDEDDNAEFEKMRKVSYHLFQV